MSKAREMNMAKIAGSIDVEDEETQEVSQDAPIDSRLETPQDVPGKKEISTRQQINILKRAKLRAKSESVQAKLQDEIDAAELRLEEEREAERQRLETIKATQGTIKTASNVASGVIGAASNVGDKVGDIAGRVGGTVGAISTPGSIFLPISLLLIFFFLILPVNGMTRAQWLWGALTGNAHINGESTPTPSEESASPEGEGDVSRGYSRGAYINPYIRRRE